jgi:hypothetical protein
VCFSADMHYLVGVIDALDCIRVCVRNPAGAETVSDPGFIAALFSGLKLLSSWSCSTSFTLSVPEGALRSERRRMRSALIDSLLKCMTNSAVQFPVYIRTLESPCQLGFLVEVS